MSAVRSEVWLSWPDQEKLSWLVKQGVPITAMIRPAPLMITTGFKAEDGVLEYSAEGETWIAFEQQEDFVFWQPRTDAIATFANRAFALGEETIGDPATYAFDCALNIFASPLEWLLARRDGIVLLDWTRAFDRLRDVPRIALAEALLPLYRRYMQPARMPELFIIPQHRSAA